MTIRVTWPAIRRVLLVVVAALGVLFVMTWYSRQWRCQAELAAWAQIRAAFVGTPATLLWADRSDPRVIELLSAYGVLRTEATVAHYCDAPVWEWWR